MTYKDIYTIILYKNILYEKKLHKKQLLTLPYPMLLKLILIYQH